jgi:hypothetical protein
MAEARKKPAGVGKTEKLAKASVKSSPRPQDLRPTENEVVVLSALWQWHRNSANSPIVLGQPVPE